MSLSAVEYGYVKRGLDKFGLRKLSQYYKTAWWKKRRQQFVQKKLLEKQYKCVLCGVRKRLEVHHVTYVAMGAEQDHHLQLRCRKHHPKGLPSGIWGWLFG